MTLLSWAGVAALAAVFAILCAGAFCMTGEDPKEEQDEAAE